MKKQLLFIAIAGLFTTMASATDRFVREAGAGGAYPTISAAITAAVNGDRIIIKPKALNVAYAENLTVNKSLTFMSETNFAKYIVDGTMTITGAAGRVVTINNCSITGISIGNATTGGRTTVNVLNSLIIFMSAGTNNTTLNMSGCEVSAETFLSHGRLTGNKLQYTSISTENTDTSLSTDDIEVIANEISTLTFMQKNYDIRVSNNFISQTLGINAVKNLTANGYTKIYNNVISNSQMENAANIGIYLAAGSSAAFRIYNNVLTNGNDYVIWNQNTTNISVNAYNNMSNSSFITQGVLNAGSNTGNAGLTVNTTTHVVTGANINAGFSDQDFTDLDLSINDIGNFGGSDSWANYWPAGAGNKPQVNYLNTPRRINFGATTLDAKGSGYSK